MHYYDAELLRLRARTHTDPDARRADLAAALELARRQGATLFELRAALDDFELRGQPARGPPSPMQPGAYPADNVWPELASARAILDRAAETPELGGAAESRGNVPPVSLAPHGHDEGD